MTNLRCFVAMALGKKDTDKLYDNCIAPHLRRRKIAPVRIDRVEHNDDIDDRIIQELKTCDLALADLTYARPSVYFEAGFAARQVPVIYTCRTDHFEPQLDDPFGNLRVHFDLKMKNIIPWSSPSDQAFVTRLNRRIERVIRPILREREAQAALAEAAEAFEALPLHHRLGQLLQTAEGRLRRAGYKGMLVSREVLLSRYPGPPEPHREHVFGKYIHYHFAHLLALHPGWLGQKPEAGVLRGTAVHVASRLTKQGFHELATSVIQNAPHDVAIALREGPVRAVLEHILLISLERVPIQRLMSWLPDFRLDSSTRELVSEGACLVPTVSLPQYPELHFRQDRRGAVFLGCRPAARGSDCSINELRVTGDKVRIANKEDVQLATVPRKVHVRLIDNIRSLKTFVIAFAAAVKQTDSEVV